MTPPWSLDADGGSGSSTQKGRVPHPTPNEAGGAGDGGGLNGGCKRNDRSEQNSFEVWSLTADWLLGMSATA